MDDSSSDGIEFMDSQGQQNVYEDEEEEDDLTQSIQRSHKSPKPDQIMYIQMEFCEKSTLRFLAAPIYRFTYFY